MELDSVCDISSFLLLDPGLGNLGFCSEKETFSVGKSERLVEENYHNSSNFLQKNYVNEERG